MKAQQNIHKPRPKRKRKRHVKYRGKGFKPYRGQGRG